MATKKTTAPLRQADIKLASKTRKDAAMLARFATQQGKAALPFLEDVLAQGSAIMRREAVKQMVKLDRKRAERAVHDVLQATLSRRPRAPESERAEQFWWLVLVGTPSAAQTFLDRGGVIRREIGLPNRALLDLVAARVPSLDEAAAVALLAQLNLEDIEGIYHLDGRGLEDSAPVRALARVLLDHAGPGVRERGVALLCLVDGFKALPVLRQLGQTPEIRRMARLCRCAPPATQYDELSGYVDIDAHHRGEILSAISHQEFDRRWFARLEPYLEEPRTSHVLALERHPPALEQLQRIAARDVFDEDTRFACSVLGHTVGPPAAPVLLRWLDDPSAHHAASELLSSLNHCGGPEAIPVIKALKRRDPSLAGSCDDTIGWIRSRANDLRGA